MKPTTGKLGAAAVVLFFAAAPRAASATTLGVDGTRFTLDGRPTFLLGMSYYGGLGASDDAVDRDLAELHDLGFNWVRLWATWSAEENDVSAVTHDGAPREPFLSRLKRIVERADALGIVVDVTLSRGNGAVSREPRLATLEAHLRAVEVVARELRPYRNVYIDVGNERNIGDRRHVPLDDVRALRDRIKEIDSERLVTASHAGDLSRDDVERYVRDCRLDFLSPHRPRHAESPAETAAKARECLAWAREAGREIPVHHQEPFRRDYSPWQPHAADFLADAIGAKEGGAAGWCLHNGSPRRGRQGAHRSFDLRERRLFEQLDAVERHVARRAAFLLGKTTRTWIDLFEGRWLLDGEVTFPGAPAAGLLMNARVVNATFEDRNPATCPAGFDPDVNTERFIAAIPDYVAHGVRAFTLCLQGGMPGYESAFNSAFAEDGSLREEYLARIERVVRAADRAGAAVILGCYYQRQDQVLVDESAVRAGVGAAARWVRDRGFGNVLLEIANEYPHGGFDHDVLRSPAGEAELIGLARRAVPGLLVSTSGLGNGRIHDEVAAAADFLLIHFNGTPVDQIAARVEALRRHGKAIVCNEDDKPGEEGARAAAVSVRAGCSWGVMLNTLNQYVPFEFGGARDDEAIYGALEELTTAR